MATCAVKRGFFVLRDCDDPAPLACATCGRPLCLMHARYPAGAPVCIECHARDRETEEPKSDDPDAWTSYAYGSRHRYYTSAHYQPLDAGQADPYYDQYDVRAFDAPEAEPVEAAEEDAGADFADS